MGKVNEAQACHTSLEVGLKFIMLPIHVKMMDTIEQSSTEAMVATGATGDFIDQDFITQAKLLTHDWW